MSYIADGTDDSMATKGVERSAGEAKDEDCEYNVTDADERTDQSFQFRSNCV